MKPKFKLGERVTQAFGKDKHAPYHLSANIPLEDAVLLKSIDPFRGLIQVVASNLIHSFCNTLRSHGITTFAELSELHYVLAIWSGRFDVSRSAGECIEAADPLTNFGSLVAVPHSEFLPGGETQSGAGEVCGGATVQDDREGRDADVAGRIAQACGAAEDVAPSTSKPLGEACAGRSKSRRGTRRAGGKENPAQG